MGCHYKHLNIDERENLLLLLGEGKTIREIAREMGRDKSTISREIARNSLGAKKSEKKKKVYRPSLAQSRYEKRREEKRREEKAAALKRNCLARKSMKR